MALALNDIVAVTFDGVSLGQAIQFGMNYRVTENTVGAAIQVELKVIADWFKDTLAGAPTANKLRAFLPTGATLNRVRVQRIFPTRSVFVAGTMGVPGGGGAGPSTVNLCATFSLHTAVAGRSQLAKYHPGPMPDSFWDNGVLLAPGLGALDALGIAAAAPTSAPSGANSIALQPVVFHRNTFTAPRWTDVVGYRLNSVVRTERRRTIGLGS